MDNQQLAERLAQGLKALSLTLSAAQQQQLLAYLGLLTKWNKTYNLTAITQPVAMLDQHLLDSLAILPWLQGQKIIDMGTGAGLPGIPLAICCPDRAFTLLDSNGKKTRFLLQAVFDLKLTNVEVIHDRVEAYNPSTCFDTLLSRAFSSLADMVQRSQHICCPDGVFLAMKGTQPSAEIDALPANVTCQTVQALTVPFLEAERHIVVLKKKS